MTLLSESPSANASSDSELAETPDWDFSSLPDATVVDEPESTDKTPESKLCPTCSEPIYREPGSRGRMPKYHPDCRPSTSTRVKNVFGTDPRPRSADRKKQAEADEVIAFVKAKLATSCTALLLVDQYTGMVWMMAVPGICDNLHGILVANDSFRRQMLAAKGGGSWIGLAISLLIPIAATCARFGLLPNGRIQEIAKNLPIMLHKISQRMKQGDAAMNDMLNRINEQAMREQNEKNGGQSVPSDAKSSESPQF